MGIRICGLFFLPLHVKQFHSKTLIDQSTIEKIIDAANIVDVVSEFVTLRRRGANYIGLCPFHDEKTPSFSVSPSKGICKCFSCGKGGNVVHFIMAHEQISFTEALEWLANKYGVTIQKKELTEQEKAAKNSRESLFVVNEFAKDFFLNTLKLHHEGKSVGMAYFRKRGFRDDIISKFQLGFCPDNVDFFSKNALEKGYKKEYLVKSGLSVERENNSLRDRFRGRVIFPIHSLSGKIVAFGGRALGSELRTAKYINSPESEIYSKSYELYGIFFAKQPIVKNDRCFLVEGYTDVISMFQAGVENVVASSGTSLTPGQIRLIHRFTDNITVLYDGDNAGIQASLRGIDMLLAEGMNVKVLLLPDGEDPDSFAQKHDSLSFLDYIDNNQIDFIRFKAALLMKEAGNDPIKKALLIKEITRSISVIPDPIIRAVYIKECGNLMQVDESLLINDINKLQVENAGNARKVAQTPNNIPDRMDSTPATLPENSQREGNTSETSELSMKPETAYSEQNQNEALSLLGDEKNSIIEREKLITQLITRHGEKVLCYTKFGDQENYPMKVGEFIIKSLKNDNIVFFHPVYKKMLRLLEDHINDKGFSSERFFVSNPDNSVSQTAALLIGDRYYLSGLFQDNNPTGYNERLFELTTHLMADYQLSLVKIEMKQLEKSLQEPNMMDNIAHLIEFQQKYKELMTLRNNLAKKLGDRVINI